MLENFSRSLQSIFDLYKEKRNSYFAFSFSFGMLSMLASGLISYIVCLLAKKVFEWEGSNDSFVNDAVAISKFTKLLSYFFILSFGLYAIYLRKIIRDESQQSNLSEHKIILKPTLKGLFKAIIPRNRTVILIVIFFVSLVYILLFKEIYNPKNDDLGFIKDQGWEYNTPPKNALIWLNSIIELLKQYIPYFGAFYIFLSDYDSSFSLSSFSKYKQSILTFLLLSFCVSSILIYSKSYLDLYIVNLITISLRMDFVKGILQIFVSVFVSAFSYLGLAASIMYPVMNQHETINSNYNESI